MSPCSSGPRSAHYVCLLPLLAARTFRPYQLSRSFSTQRRWGSTRKPGHGAGPVPCQDVPAFSLTCPARPPLPVPPGTMGGCFSKPKPGDLSPMPGPHPTVPVGEIGQRWTLARGMLMLGSCREDYWAFNPPKFLSALTPRQGAVRGCSSAGGLVVGWEGSSPCASREASLPGHISVFFTTHLLPPFCWIWSRVAPRVLQCRFR